MPIEDYKDYVYEEEIKEVSKNAKSERKRRREQAKKVGKKETKYSKKKYEFADCIIPYEDASDGEAYIGLAKKPLMKFKEGYGYQGVLLQSSNRELVQCHICGGWMQQITQSHLKTHSIEMEEYRELVGLQSQTPLISDCRRDRLRKHAFEVLDFSSEAHKKRAKEALEKGRLKRTKEHWTKRGTRTREFQNSKGTCPEQLKHYTIYWIHQNKCLPSSGYKSFQHRLTLERRYGNLNNAFLDYGLPTRVSLGAIREYRFPDGMVYMQRRGEDYSRLYNLMVEKCKVMKDKKYK